MDDTYNILASMDADKIHAVIKRLRHLREVEATGVLVFPSADRALGIVGLDFAIRMLESGTVPVRADRHDEGARTELDRLAGERDRLLAEYELVAPLAAAARAYVQAKKNRRAAYERLHSMRDDHAIIAHAAAASTAEDKSEEALIALAEALDGAAK